MKLSELLVLTAIFIFLSYATNEIRYSVGISQDARQIYRQVQNKFNEDTQEDFVAKGSLLNFFKDYPLEYVKEKNAYKLNYEDPILCMKIEYLEFKMQKNKNVEKMIDKCESNSSLLVGKTNDNEE